MSCKRGRDGADEAFGVSLRGGSISADLNDSSKYSNETFQV